MLFLSILTKTTTSWKTSLCVSLTFGAITFVTIYLFYRASNYARTSLYAILGWLLLQGIVARSGFYEDTSGMPPRFVLAVLPTFAMMAILFFTKKGKQFIHSLDEAKLTLLHTVRIVVEMVLLWLFMAGTLPEVMTFEGRNFDILAGLTAPIIYYFGYQKQRLSRNVLLLWNVVCVLLLLNVVIHAIFALPSSFQQIAFDQPNIAVLHFPFIWLPSVVVPLVMFSHFVCIYKLLKRV